MRVVVVEDEWLIAEDVRNTLEFLGHEVCAIAPTAAKAIKTIRLYKPDLVLTDISLGPDGDGVDVAIHAYQEWGIRSLFISASITNELIQRTRAIKPLGYLPKPFRHSRLQAFLAMVPETHVIASASRA